MKPEDMRKWGTTAHACLPNPSLLHVQGWKTTRNLPNPTPIMWPTLHSRTKSSVPATWKATGISRTWVTTSSRCTTWSSFSPCRNLLEGNVMLHATWPSREETASCYGFGVDGIYKMFSFAVTIAKVPFRP